MRRLVASLLVIPLVLVAAPAFAHSLLLEASPAANAAVDAAPAELRLRFNNRIEKRLSRIRLVDERGGTREAVVSEDGAADRLVARVPTLAPGRYRVEWQVLSTDGHVVTGRYHFTVNATRAGSDATRAGGR
jgi:methionine-rich copper-binding protein CopC